MSGDGTAVPGQAAHPRCPRDHRKWGRCMPMDRIPSRYGGGWGCPGILTDGTDCGYELDANGQPRAVAAAAAQPAPGHMQVMRGTIALRDAEIELLNRRVAELAEALGEAAGHVEPLDQNSELAVGRWLELAKRYRAAQPAPGRGAPQ